MCTWYRSSVVVVVHRCVTRCYGAFARLEEQQEADVLNQMHEKQCVNAMFSLRELKILQYAKDFYRFATFSNIIIISRKRSVARTKTEGNFGFLVSAGGDDVGHNGLPVLVVV
jgi:hypothetical protein